jgi:hypothetical protein
MPRPVPADGIRPKALAAGKRHTIMGAEPLRVQMLGLLPAVLKPCGPTCAQPFMPGPVQELASEQDRETPAVVRENADRAHALAEQLFRDFGDSLRIEVVGLDSPRGLWLGLRHRVGRGFAVIVDGRETFQSPSEYGPVRRAVEQALRHRSGTED